ncbi:LysR family transcriptional regulator [Candidatus Saccharibacteria bacterium]|nr:MAG: LysR family transcriptional regulator [Candidatus Saccharibacteria bacterium]
MDDSLKKFVAVVEAGTFTRAAETLHISQPALSVAMSKLAKKYGVVLFESTGRSGVQLTPAGEYMYNAGLEQRRIEHNLQSQLTSIGGEKVPLRIGLIDSVAALLTTTDEPLKTLESRAQLSLYVENSTALRQAVRRSELDVAIIVADDAQDDKLEVAAVASDNLFMVCSPSEVEQFEVAIVQGIPVAFLSYVPESMTFTVIERSLRPSGIKVNPIVYSTSPDSMLAMASRGRGVAILPEILVKRGLESGVLVRVNVQGKPYAVRRRLHVVTLKGRKLPPRLVGLALAMREQLKTYTVG